MKATKTVAVLFSAAMLTLSLGCGGGGGGGGTLLPPAKGTFIKTPSSTMDTYGYIFPTTSGSRLQGLYTAGTISASGEVTSVAFQYQSDLASAVTCTGVTIKLGQTNLSALSTTFANNVNTGQGSEATVLSNGLVTFPSGSAGTWTTIKLAKPFSYNGIDNLVLDVEVPTACSGTFPVRSAFESTAFNGMVYSFTPGSPTGSTNTFVPNAKLGFTGGDDHIEIGDTGSGNYYPFSMSTANRVQQLYLANEINGSGPITGIGMRVGGLTTGATYTYTITLGHTTETALTTTFADNFNKGKPVTVADSMSVTIPAGIPKGSYVWLPIKGSFNYNGKDNLILDVVVSSGTGTTQWYDGNGGAGRRAYGNSGSAVAAVTDAYSYHTAFRFNGGQIVVIPTSAGSSYSSQVLGSGGAGQLQSLYPQWILGTSGTIRNLYVRLRPTATPTATSLANYTVYMGQTDKTALNMADDYASNMDGNKKVFSGTLTIPANLNAGDWVKIPLKSSFAYNGKQNLCILFMADAGPSGNDVSVRHDTTQFPSFIVGRSDNSVGTSGLPTWNYDGILDLAIDISK